MFSSRNLNSEIPQDHVMFNSGYETRALDFEFEENGEKFTDVKGGCARK